MIEGIDQVVWDFNKKSSEVSAKGVYNYIAQSLSPSVQTWWYKKIWNWKILKH